MASASGEGKEAYMGMSRAEAEGIFHLFDTDKSGTIELAELRELAFAMGVTLSDSGLEGAFEVLDADKSGTIDFEEFYTWLTSASSDEDASTMLQLEMQARLMGRQALQVARSFMSTSVATDDTVTSLKFSAATDPAPAPEEVATSMEASVQPGDAALRGSKAGGDEKATAEVVFILRTTVVPEQAQAWVEDMNALIDGVLDMAPIPPGILSRVAFTLDLAPPTGPPTLTLGVYASQDPIAFGIEMAHGLGVLPPGAESLVDLLGERGVELLSKATVAYATTRSTLQSLGLVPSSLSAPELSSLKCTSEVSRTFLRQLIVAVKEAVANLPSPMARDAKKGIAVLRAVEAFTHLELELEMDSKRSHGMWGSVLSLVRAVSQMPGVRMPLEAMAMLDQVSEAASMPAAGPVALRGQVLSWLRRREDLAPLLEPGLVDIFKAVVGNDTALLPNRTTVADDLDVMGGPPGPEDKRWVAWHAAWFLLNGSGLQGFTLASESLGGTTSTVGGELTGLLDETLDGVQAWVAAELLGSGPRAALRDGGADPPGIAVMCSHIGMARRLTGPCRKWSETSVMSRLGPLPFNVMPERRRGPPEDAADALERAVGEASDLGQALSAAGGHSPFAVVAGVVLVVDGSTPASLDEGKALVDAFLEGAAGTARPLVVAVVSEIGGAPFDEAGVLGALGLDGAVAAGTLTFVEAVPITMQGLNLPVALLHLEHAIADGVGSGWKQQLQEADLAAAL